MSNIHYVLDEKGNPRPEPDLMAWALWMESSHEFRRVAREQVGSYDVSTVFLGLDHGIGRSNRAPVLWETMIFGDGPLRGEMDRCSGSREQAEAMHAKMVEYVKGKL